MHDENPRIELPATLENLPRFIAFAADQARRRGFSASRVGEIELVLEEALVNVIRYAYPESEGDLALEIRSSPESGLVLEIRDRGVSFNPLENPPPDLEADILERAVGGLGIYFIKELADRVSWRRQDQENILTLAFSDNNDKN
ncbi:MAG: ATP-binding protein [Deltaproteobacteria bacterium]|nr:ATP-binding protein [Deltaproteobacteria bacterium]